MVQRFKDALHTENSMKGATYLLIVTLFLSNILGFMRDHFLAQKIPAAAADMYFNAFNLPDLVFNVLILGAVSTAFIPVFTDYIFKKGKDAEAWRVANTIINLSVILLGGSLALLFILMPYIIPIVSPFNEPERVHQTVVIARVLIVQPIFFGLSYIAGSILNSFKRFVAYSIAPLIYNLSIIGGILYLTPRFGVMGVVYGVLIGALLHFMIQVPTLFSLGYHYKPTLDLKHPAVRQIAKLMIPRTIHLILLQLIALIFGRIAAQLTVGSVSSLTFANNIQTVPTVVFGNAFALASFPYLSESFSKKHFDQFDHYLTRSVRAALFFLIPSAIGLYLLRIQVVRLILGTGHFGWTQTIMTADTLGMYAIGLVAVGILPLYSRAFFAMHDTKTPMLTTIPITILTVILGYAFGFYGHMGVSGLALASSISTVLQLAVLYLIVRKRIGLKRERDLLVSTVTYIMLGLVMAAAIQLAKNFIGNSTDLRYGINVLIQGGLGIFVGALVYLGLAALLRLEEVEFLWQRKKIFTTN